MESTHEIEEEEEQSPVAYCERCEQGVFDEDDLYEVKMRVRYNFESKYWCETCRDNHAERCGDCRDYFSELTYSDPPLCESCAEEYFCCDNCGEVLSVGSYGEDGQCQDCAPHEDDAGLLDYSSDVSTSPIGEAKVYFGVELECEVHRDDVKTHVERVRDTVDDFAILKSDASLDNGFEIVSRPMSLPKHLENWQRFFALSKGGLKSFETSTCGLHVHASRSPLTEMTIAKIVCFVNSERNKDFIRCIAQRESNNWSRIKPKKLSYAYKRNADRYEAVNLQNRATIEFRLFKGTLRKVSFFKSIEFCDALIQFCAPASRSLSDSMQHALFVNFVKKNKKTWPHLSAYIDAKWTGIETEETKKLGFKTVENNREE